VFSIIRSLLRFSLAGRVVKHNKSAKRRTSKCVPWPTESPVSVKLCNAAGFQWL